MTLYLTFEADMEHCEIKRISTTPPNDIDDDQYVVFKIDWDGESDIPVEPIGDVYEGTLVESNYKEDGIVRIRATGEIKLCVNGELIPMPDDYSRFRNTYSRGILVDSIKLDGNNDCLF